VRSREHPGRTIATRVADGSGSPPGGGWFTAPQIAAAIGDKTLAEVQRYTIAAHQMRLARISKANRKRRFLHSLCSTHVLI
jgi:hypothetical protein